MSTPPIPDHAVTYSTRDGEEVATVTVVRTYAGDVDDVWGALTDPERLPRWFAPVHGDLRLGGRYQVEGNAGGQITACDPPRSFASTWEMGPFVSWLVVEVTPSDPDASTVTLAHTVATDNDHWRTFGPAAVGIGWDMSVLGLGLHLAGQEAPVGADDVNAWSVGPEGKPYLTACGESWLLADVTGGATEQEARARADACIAFYTTIPEEDGAESPAS